MTKLGLCALSLALTLFALPGCDALIPAEPGADVERITVGDPTFSVNAGPGFNEIFRVAWTGSKLWAITDLDGSSQTPQRLLEIDPSDGSIVRSLTPARPMWSLDYANGFLMDTNTFWYEGERYAERYDPVTGAAAGRWTYEGTYDIHYYIVHDGGSYRGLTNYTCNGSNCQALIEYGDDGAVLGVDEEARYDDLTFGGGHFWAYSQWDGDLQLGGLILKLDADLQVVQTYHVTDYGRFGETRYGNELAMHLVYIDSTLWIVDRQGNFFQTSLH